jgi:hypothetical protein
MHSGAPSLPDVALQATDACVPKGSELYLLIAAISGLIMKSRIQPDAIAPGGKAAISLQR